LSCDQCQQSHRLGLLVVKIDVLQTSKDSQSVVDQGGDQLVAGGRIIPGNVGFARHRVLIPGQPSNKVHRRRNGAGDPADLRDQLGDGVLASDRIIKDRRVDRATTLSGQDTRLGDDLGNRVEDPVRSITGRETATPIRQHRVMETGVGHREPTCGFPPQIERDRLRCLPVREIVDGLQNQHRRDHIGRDRRPAMCGRRAILRRWRPTV